MSRFKATAGSLFFVCLLSFASPSGAQQDLRFEQYSPQAEQYWKKVVQHEPANANAYYHLGRHYEFTRRIGDAAESYRKATSLNPGFAEAYFSLGKAYRELYRYEEAAAALKRATTLKSNFARAYHFLGLVNIDLGRYEEAADALVQAYTHNPGAAETYYDNTTYGMHHELGNDKEIVLRLVKHIYPVNQHLAKIVYNRWARAGAGMKEFWEVVSGRDLPRDAGYRQPPVTGYFGPEEAGYQGPLGSGYQRRSNQPSAPEDLAD